MLEWLDRGTYTYHTVNPPLARIAVALGPYWRGARSHGLETAIEEGNAILHTNNQYRENLRASRLGTLPFVALGCILTGLWALRWYGKAAAVASMGLFSILPPILGHGSLATTDVAAASTFTGAVYALTLWLEEPKSSRTVWLGAAAGVAMLAKFTALPMLGACAAAGAGWRRLRSGGAPADGVR